MKILSTSINKLKVLEVLDISKNKIRTLPTTSIFELRFLKNFQCSNNYEDLNNEKFFIFKIKSKIILNRIQNPFSILSDLKHIFEKTTLSEFDFLTKLKKIIENIEYMTGSGLIEIREESSSTINKLQEILLKIITSCRLTKDEYNNIISLLEKFFKDLENSFIESYPLFKLEIELLDSEFKLIQQEKNGETFSVTLETIKEKV